MRRALHLCVRCNTYWDVLYSPPNASCHVISTFVRLYGNLYSTWWPRVLKILRLVECTSSPGWRRSSGAYDYTGPFCFLQNNVCFFFLMYIYTWKHLAVFVTDTSEAHTRDKSDPITQNYIDNIVFWQRSFATRLVLTELNNILQNT